MRHALWIGLCLLVSSSAPAGQERFERHVREQITRQSVKDKGYDLTH
jgi:hypothetical protein